MAEAGNTQSQRYLTLTLGGELFALDIFAVREILDYSDITRIPQTPASMRGVVNVRGNAVPVVDLGLKLGLGEVARTIHTRIVIMEVSHDGQTALMGALADSVKEVLDLSADTMAPPPKLGASVDAGCLKGITNHGGRFILHLDMDRVFSTDEIHDLSGLLADGVPGTEAEAGAMV